MKHVGIIAEYNPFHNGHQYQIAEIKKSFPEKQIITVMSGDFVQRGEPAIYDKYIRTRLALLSGVDIIFELPPRYAFSSAEYFADAAVCALAKTNVIDTLCFGAETDNLSLLSKLADLFLEEPKIYCDLLKKHLANGYSYPKSRSQAVAEYWNDDSVLPIIEQPNNILAIEYLKAIKRHNFSITPFIIKRTQNNYNNPLLQGKYASATAIRYAIQDNNKEFANYIPDMCAAFLKDSQYAKPIYLQDFYDVLIHTLWNTKKYEQYSEISEEIANKLRNYTIYPDSYEKLIDELTDKNYTTTRIKRGLLNLILNNQKTETLTDTKTNISYLRLLGFEKNASKIIKDIQANSGLEIINKVTSANKVLSSSDYKLFQTDLRYSTLYQQIFYNKYHLRPQTEFEHTVIFSDNQNIVE